MDVVLYPPMQPSPTAKPLSERGPGSARISLAIVGTYTWERIMCSKETVSSHGSA